MCSFSVNLSRMVILSYEYRNLFCRSSQSCEVLLGEAVSVVAILGISVHLYCFFTS